MANMAHETLSREITASQDGYIFVYVSNESQWDVNTFFDELIVTHNHIDIVQHDDYYPFGLAFNQNADRSLKNKYLYQGKELQDELGLDLYSFEMRSYDPVLGRWLQIDPKASERESPYVGMANNPLLYVDPLGDTIVFGQFTINNFWTDTDMGRDLSSWGKPIKDFLTFKAEKDLPGEKADSGLKDGVIVEKEGNQPDNAPKGEGNIVDETMDVDGVPPSNLDRTKTLFDAFVAPFVEIKPPTYEPIKGDSGVYRDQFGRPRVGVKLTPGGGLSPIGSRPVRDKADSTKYNLIKK